MARIFNDWDDEQERKNRTGVFCTVCGKELTQEELKIAKETGKYLCSDCRRDWLESIHGED